MNFFYAPSCAQFPWLVVAILLCVHLVVAFWCTKAFFFGADRTFLKLDKMLRKQGMRGLFTFMQVFMMAIVIIFGMIETVLVITQRFKF